MSVALVPTAPNREELEALTLADRVALEDAFGEAHDLIRSLNDAEIGRLHDAGASQRAIAEACGRSTAWVRQRLGAQSPSEARRLNNQPLPQNGDIPDAEVVDGEIVEGPPARRRREAERPAHHLPDVVSADAETNLRTQALHWFEQGRHLEELLDEGVVLEPRSGDDKQAIKREADEMVRIARRLKGATRVGR